jgi:hypothetical protein
MYYIFILHLFGIVDMIFNLVKLYILFRNGCSSIYCDLYLNYKLKHEIDLYSLVLEVTRIMRICTRAYTAPLIFIENFLM